jgi:predicted ATPase
LKLLRTAIERLRAAKFSQYQVAFLGVLAECLVRAGHVDEGQAAIEDALLQCKQTEATWCMSELLRIKGEIAALETSNGAAVAEQKFLEAMGWAHRQQVLSWELRSATSLAKLWGKQGRIAAARALLTPIYSQFTEGFDTADLKLAKSFLQDAPSDMKTEKDIGNPN